MFILICRNKTDVTYNTYYYINAYILDAVLFNQICFFFGKYSVKVRTIKKMLISFYNKYNIMIIISLGNINNFTFERL